MKEIWLKIAEHEIGKDSSVTADILSAAKGVITVADVLKYFPEFATIDHFKQALCSSLVAVSRQIDEHQVRKMTLNIRWGTDGHFVRIRHGKDLFFRQGSLFCPKVIKIMEVLRNHHQLRNRYLT